MPRYARGTIAGVIYHIMHRGNNKQVVFFTEDDYSYFIELIKQAKKNFKVKIYSYCLMTNHVHILLEPEITEHLAKFIKFIAQNYTQYINKTYKRTGTFWEGRYKSCAVSNDIYLFACSRYIEMNPLRAGLAGDPLDYEYSSYHHKVGARKENFLDYDPFYLSLGSTDTERHIHYKEEFRKAIPEGEWKSIQEGINRNSVFGNEKFRNQIEQAIGRKITQKDRGRPRKDKEGDK